MQSNKFPDKKVGVIVDIFGDLNPEEPWLRDSVDLRRHQAALNGVK